MGGREGRREVLVSVHIFTHTNSIHREAGQWPWLVYIVHTAQCLLAAAHYSINLPHPDYLSPIYYIFSSCLCTITNDNASHFMSLILQVLINPSQKCFFP